MTQYLVMMMRLTGLLVLSHNLKEKLMSEWTNGSLINETVIANLSPEQLKKLEEMLRSIK